MVFETVEMQGFFGKTVDGRSLRNAVGSMSPGSTIDLKVLRGSTERNYSIILDRMPDDTQRADSPRRRG